MIGDFDDDLFATPKEKKTTGQCGYEAKCCNREWYLNDSALADSSGDDKSQILKFRADHAYGKADYSVALAYYKEMMENNEVLSTQMAREVTQSIGHCYLKIGESQHALQWGLKMWHQSKSKDQKINSWAFFSRVYRQLKQYDNEVLAHLQILHADALYVFYWASFGEALAYYWGITSLAPTALPKVIGACNGEPQLLSGLSENAVRFVIGACFIRARLLAERGKRFTQMSGNWTCNSVLDRAEHWINKLQLSEVFQRTATENMMRDLHNEAEEPPESVDSGEITISETDCAPRLMDSESDEHVQIFVTDQSYFYKMWFGWIDSCMP